MPSQFRPLTEQELQALITALNESDIRILFIALGSPMQELFAGRLAACTSPRLRPFAVFTVGAAVDFIAGVKKQAPAWMGDAGLEWLFRLIHEPGRLWKRYLVYGTLYFFYFVKHYASRLSKTNRQD
jgi:N-acetylglucosaminyldiphosphoundecaprenol N-acetyl-beta-D-mannosaminyltransferase